MKRILLILIKLFFNVIILFSQEITNIRFEQEGKKINIYYNLSGDYEYEVRVYYSINGNIWNGPLKFVSYDVGKNQRAGMDKRIEWDVLSECNMLQSDVKFKVTALYQFPGESDDEIPDYVAPAKIGSKEAPECLEILMVAESMPEFIGGEEALYKYLLENVNYPQSAKESGIQGRVFVTFVVELDGSVTDVRVLRGIGGGCDEEAVRVVKNMPKWIPGKQKGKSVRVQYNLPLKFTLTSGSDKPDQK